METDAALNMSEAITIPVSIRVFSRIFTASQARFSIRQTTDPRDRVYGMLGSGTDEYASLVEPDYARSPEQVCEALAIRSVERTGALEFLSHVFGHYNPKLSSLIPN